MQKTFWIVCRTKPSRERYAMKNAARHPSTLRTYLPVIAGKKGKEEMFLPGFLFVLTHGQWRYLTGTYGVSSVLMIGDRAGILPHKHMRQLRKMVGDEQKARAPVLRYEKDQDVRVTKGPWRDFVGKYQRTTPEQRIRIVLSFMQRTVHVDLEPDFVKAA